MIGIKWEDLDCPKLRGAEFRVLKLTNGETVGALCRSEKTGRWTTTQTDKKIHATEKEARNELLSKAYSRIWFLSK